MVTKKVYSDIYCLTNHVYSTTGKLYSSYNWNLDWNIFVKIAYNERKITNFKDAKPVNHIIYWFDTNILQRIRKDSKTTLDVRVRIICGMINKLDANKVSFELKIRFMECIWDTYKEFSRDWEEWHAKWILGLPF
jgi:CRISPR/Cas system CSM-associated protein Csm5 (group 7 of RAMP superfamily)